MSRAPIIGHFRAWKPHIPYAIKNQRGASKIPPNKALDQWEQDLEQSGPMRVLHSGVSRIQMMGRSRGDKFRIVTNALTNWRWCDVQNLMMINNIDWPEWSSQTSIRLITKYIILPKISNHQRVDKFYLSFEIFWHLKGVKWKCWLKYPKSSSTL